MEDLDWIINQNKYQRKDNRTQQNIICQIRNTIWSSSEKRNKGLNLKARRKRQAGISDPFMVRQY